MRNVMIGTLMIVASLLGVYLFSKFLEAAERKPQDTFNPATWPQAKPEFSIDNRLKNESNKVP
jgi:hypothetical protein